jgi:hypothetical protein
MGRAIDEDAAVAAMAGAALAGMLAEWSCPGLLYWVAVPVWLLLAALFPCAIAAWEVDENNEPATWRHR